MVFLIYMSFALLIELFLIFVQPESPASLLAILIGFLANTAVYIVDAIKRNK